MNQQSKLRSIGKSPQSSSSSQSLSDLDFEKEMANFFKEAEQKAKDFKAHKNSTS